MLFQKIKQLRGCAATKRGRSRLAVWCAVLVMCLGLSWMVLRYNPYIYRDFVPTELMDQDFSVYTLEPGATVRQEFVAQGKSNGACWEAYLNILRAEGTEGNLSLRVLEMDSGSVMAEMTAEFADIPGAADLEAVLQEAEQLRKMDVYSRPESHEISPELAFYTAFASEHEYWFHSGRRYALELTNHSQADTVYLLGNASVQGSSVLVDGEAQDGFLNIGFMRQSRYAPSKLLWVFLPLAVVTVLTGLGLVLFTDVKLHVLYLVLAVGFGAVSLFAVTPLYGFDMTFQFDSAYIASNKLLGLEGAVYTESARTPGAVTAHYYRRACDDYSQYQLYWDDEIHANYTDVKSGIASPFASQADQELILVESDRGYVNESPYLFLPQAIGFAVARLLGLGLYPMLQLARMCIYGVFVLTMYYVIRTVPFGKGIFLIWGLIPTVLIQTMSLSYDAMILTMSFFVIATVLRLAYADRKPRLYEWGMLLVVSAMLLPCKWIYAPVSCSFLLVVYRQYILPSGGKWKKPALLAGCVLLVLAAAVVVLKWPVFASLLRSLTSTEPSIVNGYEAYTVGSLLANPGRTLFVVLNTLRSQLGDYLVNAVQLFDIRIGAGNGITLVVYGLLFLELFSTSGAQLRLRTRERLFMQLVVAGVLALVMVASFRWTPISDNAVLGLQGRYLTPVLPLLFLSFHNNSLIRIQGKTDLLVKAGCCIFPALSLMNIFLWSINT